MKTMVFGQVAQPMELSNDVGLEALFLQPNVVSVGGLYPMLGGKTSVKIRTRFNDTQWCDRYPSLDELLLMWDVPETVSKGLAAEDKSSLEASVKVPLRIRRGLCLSLAMRLGLDAENSNPVRNHDAEWNAMELPENSSRVSESVLDPPQRELKRILPAGPTSVKSFQNTSTEKVKLSHIERDALVGRPEKALKNDDAQAPEELWNGYLMLGLPEVVKVRDWRAHLDVLRDFFLRQYKRMFYRSAIQWIKKEEAKGLVVSPKSFVAIREGLYRVMESSWWEWQAGSTPFFWRWPEEFQERIRDGIPPWISGQPAPWGRAQRGHRDPEKTRQVKKKLDKIRKRGYVEAGYVESLISFFVVEKGSDDIRMVYDGSASGLNDLLWAPWFPLPTLDTLQRSIEPGTYMSDNDVGEMFLNFILHEDLRKLCGVDFTLYYPEELNSSTSKVLWERWQRCAMGLRPSPYQAIQGLLWAEEVILGDRRDSGNVFRWDRVHLNLPGSIDYDPTKSWVRKLRADDQLAAGLQTYIDYTRNHAPSEVECWKVSQRVSSTLGFLGIQDASRKRRARCVN
jgi:hypothetical protein